MTSSKTFFRLSSLLPQINTSQSTMPLRSWSFSALTLLKAATNSTFLGSIRLMYSAADPSHSPTVLVGFPPTELSNGTITLITSCPSLNTGLIVLKISLKRSNGTERTTMSACLVASGFANPVTLALGPTESLIFLLASFALS